MKNILMNFLGLALIVLLVNGAVWAQNNYQIEATYVNLITAGMIEQDVFVEKKKGSGKVYRILPEEMEQYQNSALYTSKAAHEHEFFDKTATGPYQKGNKVERSLGEWLNGSGSATCSCENGWGTVEASFQNLMPNATYTMWHAFMAKDNTDEFIGTFDLPLGARDGSQSVFTTDAQGNANMKVRFERCLQLSDTQLISVLAIAWHSDGKTYGIEAGPFGQVSHLQLVAPLPERKDVMRKDMATKGK